MLSCLLSTLHTLSHLKLHLNISTLTDALLGLLLDIGSQLHSVSLGSAKLTTYEHAEKVWPWDELVLYTVCMSDITRLPHVRRVAANCVMIHKKDIQVRFDGQALLTSPKLALVPACQGSSYGAASGLASCALCASVPVGMLNACCPFPFAFIIHPALRLA